MERYVGRGFWVERRCPACGRKFRCKSPPGRPSRRVTCGGGCSTAWARFTRRDRHPAPQDVSARISIKRRAPARRWVTDPTMTSAVLDRERERRSRESMGLIRKMARRLVLDAGPDSRLEPAMGGGIG